MKRINIYPREIMLSLVSFFYLSLSAQQNQNNTLLWKVEGENIQPSYIFGTIHMINKKDFKIRPTAQSAFDNSDKLILEVDMSNPEEMANIASLMVLPNGEKIQSFGTEEEIQKIDSLLMNKLGMSIQMMENMKPFFIMSLLTNTLMGSNTESYDITFMELALDSNKPIGQLETLEYQIGLFDELPYDEQIDQLIDQFITHGEEMQNMLDTLTQNYLDQNIEALYNQISSEYINEEFITKLLDHRNANWVEILPDLCADQSCFIAVGSAHLAGQNGLLNLLKNAGYKVTPGVNQ